MTRMLQDLELPTLQHRREFNRVVYLYKIVGGMVPAIDTYDFLVSQRPKRLIKASNSQISNLKILLSDK